MPMTLSRTMTVRVGDFVPVLDSQELAEVIGQEGEKVLAKFPSNGEVFYLTDCVMES